MIRSACLLIQLSIIILLMALFYETAA